MAQPYGIISFSSATPIAFEDCLTEEYSFALGNNTMIVTENDMSIQRFMQTPEYAELLHTNGKDFILALEGYHNSTYVEFYSALVAVCKNIAMGNVYLATTPHHKEASINIYTAQKSVAKNCNATLIDLYSYTKGKSYYYTNGFLNAEGSSAIANFVDRFIEGGEQEIYSISLPLPEGVISVDVEIDGVLYATEQNEVVINKTAGVQTVALIDNKSGKRTIYLISDDIYTLFTTLDPTEVGLNTQAPFGISYQTSLTLTSNDDSFAISKAGTLLTIDEYLGDNTFLIESSCRYLDSLSCTFDCLSAGLTNFTPSYYNTDFSARSYIVVNDAQGNEYIVYNNTITANIAEMVYSVNSSNDIWSELSSDAKSAYQPILGYCDVANTAYSLYNNSASKHSYDIGFIYSNANVTDGDANEDTYINVMDLIRAMKYLKNTTVSINHYAIDLNKDFVINSSDLILLRKKLLNN